jgi:hypothetical protein
MVNVNVCNDYIKSLFRDLTDDIIQIFAFGPGIDQHGFILPYDDIHGRHIGRFDYVHIILQLGNAQFVIFKNLGRKPLQTEKEYG